MNKLVLLALCSARLVFAGYPSGGDVSALPDPSSPSGSVCNVADFGAKGNGTTLDTKAVQQAIDKCSVCGGEVFFPAGRFLTGSVVLKSNVEIYLSRGTVILGSTSIRDYQAHAPDENSYNDSFLKYSLFYAYHAENISIKGEGTIDGQGAAFKVTTNKKPERYMDRPFIIRFVDCRNVSVEGITMRNSAMWMQDYFACRYLTIKGIKVFNHANQNNDMMDIDGCSNVLVLDCFGDTDDDGITLKSTSPLPDENIVVSNCIVSSHCNAVKLGTESTGGFRNINISDIVVKPSAVKSVIFGKPGGICGLALETVDGGAMDGVNISNITMDSVEVPLFIRLGSRGRKYSPNAPKPDIGTIRNVSISNVVATYVGSTGCSITGIPDHDVEGISLDNIRIVFDGGGTMQDAGRTIPEYPGRYPESTMWGPLPAYGFFIRHGENISMHNVQLTYSERETRPAIVCDEVDNSELSDISASCDSDAISLFEFRNVKNTLIRSSGAISTVGEFLHATGSGSADIKLIGNDFTNVKNPVGGKASGAVLSKGAIDSR